MSESFKRYHVVQQTLYSFTILIRDYEYSLDEQKELKESYAQNPDFVEFLQERWLKPKIFVVRDPKEWEDTITQKTGKNVFNETIVFCEDVDAETIKHDVPLYSPSNSSTKRQRPEPIFIDLISDDEESNVQNVKHQKDEYSIVLEKEFFTDIAIDSTPKHSEEDEIDNINPSSLISPTKVF